MDTFVQSQYEMSIDQAISQLVELKASMLNIIYFLSKGLTKK